MMVRISRSELRLFIVAVVILLCLGSIVVRLWVLQVVKADLYSSKIGTSSKVTVRIPAVRGEFRDRNGMPLVQNRASYNVDFYLPEMVGGYRQRNGSIPKLAEQQTVRGM